MHKERSFSLRMSSANVTKSTGNFGLVTFIEEMLNGKLHFLCSDVRGQSMKLLQNWLAAKIACFSLQKPLVVCYLYTICYKLILLGGRKSLKF